MIKGQLEWNYRVSVLAIRLFYLLLFAVLFEPIKFYLFDFEKIMAPVEFVEIYSWVPREQFPWIAQLSATLAVLSFLGCAIYPWSRWLRLLASLMLLIIVGFISSYGKVRHGFYGCWLASIVMTFLPAKQSSQNKEITEQIFHYAQFSSVMCYAMAGIWKLRHIPIAFERAGWDGLTQALGNAIAYEHVASSYAVSPLSMFFLNHDWISAFMFFGLVALQVFSPILVAYEGLHLAFGILIVMFHVLSEMILKIAFRPQLALMVLFFILVPLARAAFRADPR